MKKLIIMSLSVILVCLSSSEVFACMQNDLLYSAKYDANLWMAPSWEKGASRCSFSLSLPDGTAESNLSVTDAFLVLSFKNDGGYMDLMQSAIVTEGYQWSYLKVNTGNFVIPVSEDGIIALNRDGSLAFTLGRLIGDFTFESAQLLAFAEPSPVPIPSSVLLLAPVMCFMLAMRKRLIPA